MKHSSLVVTLLSSVLISGCSWFGGDDEDAAILPAELVKFKQEVSIQRQWSASVWRSVGLIDTGRANISSS